ncbi:MAG TPA: choice-of-anchor D domain-containing protein [Candidatus Cloacimonadota bacterium]|nr:choice-of-anchor D domain-containing protein [Candidatus Cloacimonadota bacterium]
MKKILLLVMALVLATAMFADVVIGTGTSTQYYPMSTYYNYYRSAALYLASEINVSSGGTITHLKWYCGTANTTTSIPVTIYMKQTTATTLASDTWANINVGTTSVYTGTCIFNATGWYTFDINDFAYDGTSNLEILVESGSAPFVSPYVNWRYTTTTTNLFTRAQADGSAPTSLTASTYRPNITLVGITTPIPPNPTTLISPLNGATGVLETATLNWNAASGATGYKLYFGTDNPPTNIVNGTNLGDVLTYDPVGNMAFNTTFYWKVVPTNAYGDASGCPVWSFTTRPDPTIYTFPWVTDFGTTGTPWPPTNWNKYSGVLANPTVLGSPGTGSWLTRVWRTDGSTNYAAVINIFSTVNGWLITPPISIPANDYELKFDLALTDYYSSNPITSDPNGTTGTDDVFAVLIGDGTSWTPANVVRQWDNAGSPYVYNNISYLGETITIPMGAAGTKYVAFYGCSTTANADNDLFVDNVIVRQTPTAPIFTLTPDVTEWNFGLCPTQVPATKQFTITNTGSGTLVISSVVANGDYYSISEQPTDTNLTTNESTNFTVQFLPTVAGGPYTGSVTITYSSGERSTYVINLSGSAYAPATLPLTEGFESGWNNWIVVNGTQTNQWCVGTATFHNGAQSAYISNDNGVTNAYNTGSTSIVHIYKDIAFDANSLNFPLTFWWKGYGESAYYDYLQVFVVDTNVTPVAGTRLTSGQVGSNYNMQNTWTQANITLPATLSGTVKRLVFSWWNDGSGGTQPPIAIDDISLTATPMPTEPTFSYAPSSINFGTVMNGVQTGPQNVTITNTGGGTLSINVSDISIIGTNADQFSFSDDNLPANLTFQQSVVIPVYVTGTTEGAISATLRITNAYRTDHDVALSATVLPVGISIIGNGTANLYLPIYPYYGYTYSQSIFLQSEIGVTGQKMIDKIYYHWNGAGEATNSNNWTVYMGHTSLNAFATGTSWIPLSSLTQVFTGEVALPAVDEWIEIPLDTPFLYNGTDNLAICVDENESSYDSSIDYFYCTSTTAYRSIRYYDDYTNPDPAAPPAGTTVLGYPNLMLHLFTPQAFVNLTYPADGAINVPLTPAGFDFTWNAWLPGGPITGYDFYIATSEETITDDPVYAEYGLTGTSHNAIANGWTPSYNTRYFWMVTANNAETSMNSAVYSFTFQADPRITLPYTQDFGTTLTWPLNWTQSFTTGGSNRWSVTDTNIAGGTSNEMTAEWASGTFISRLITPPINTTGITTFVAKFKHYYNDYAAGITYKMQYSYDLNTWYDSPWTNASGTGDASGTVNVIFTGINQPITYVAWVLDGDHYQFDFWYVDDVQLMVPLNNDVGVASWDVTQQVYPEGAVVTPKATVTNYGLNTQSFTVTCTIGSYSNTQSVSNLAFGATQQVTFANYLPTVWTAELATVTTNLATDEDAANNTAENVVICLPLNTPALANNAQTDQYVQFNLDNPGTLNPLANGYTGSYFMSGGAWVNGTWKTVEYDDGTLTTDNYYDINPLSGASTLIGPTGAALMGIAFDDNDGTGDTLYGVSSDGYLYTVDITTGAATVIDSLWYDLGAQGQHSLANIGGLMIDIAYDNADNILYGVDLGNDCLWTINPATCELTFIGYFGIDLNYAQGASLDEVNGLMFLAGYSNGGALYWVDTTYGGAYKVGSFGTNAYELDAFAIPYGTAPETPVVTAATSGRVLSWPNVQGAAQYKIYASDDPYGTFTYYATAYTNSWTDPDITSAKKFYKVTAVGGRMANNRQPIRYTNELRKTKVSSPKPASFGIANAKLRK